MGKKKGGKGCKLGALLALVMFLGLALAASVNAAVTVTATVPTDATTNVGGLPLCMNFTGTADSGTTTVTLPSGFITKEIVAVPGSTTPKLIVWLTEMGASAAFAVAGTSAGTSSMDGSLDITVTAGQVVFAAGAFTNTEVFYGRVCR